MALRIMRVYSKKLDELNHLEMDATRLESIGDIHSLRVVNDDILKLAWEWYFKIHALRDVLKGRTNNNVCDELEERQKEFDSFIKSANERSLLLEREGLQ